MSGNSFKDRLAATMDAAGIRQSDLVRMAAEKGAKLGKSQVSQYVSGKVTPRRDVMALLADRKRHHVTELQQIDCPREVLPVALASLVREELVATELNEIYLK